MGIRIIFPKIPKRYRILNLPHTRIAVAILLFLNIFYTSSIWPIPINASPILLNDPHLPSYSKYVLTWIVDMNGRQGISPPGCVALETVTKKIVLVFCPDIKELVQFRIGRLAMAATVCVPNILDLSACDYSQPYKFFSKNKTHPQGKEYKIRNILFAREPKNFRLAHGLDDKETIYRSGLMIHADIITRDDFYMQLSFKDPSDARRMKSLGRNDLVTVAFDKKNSEEAWVNGIKMRIITMTI